MTIIQTKAYRDAFGRYLRNGTPIRLSQEDVHSTEQYVWRTLGDEKVRMEHRRNDGRVFSWSDPPATGHPGEAPNCRCEAVPYVPGETEFAYHEFTTSLASSYDRWSNKDFRRYYFFGGGRPVTLLEIGHLREIAEHYAYSTGVEGAFRRLAGQIATAARGRGPGTFTYDFEWVYDFGDVEFSHGYGTVSGLFSGFAEDHGAIYAIDGESTFKFQDEFKDPLDIGVEPGGTPYLVTGDWTASFTAQIFKDEAASEFFYKPTR